MDPQAYVEMAQVEDRHWWFRARREIINSLLDAMALPVDARILEVGSGTGGNFRMLAGHGKLFAMEMDPGAIAIARQRTGTPVTLARGECPGDMPFPDEAFDLVCMLDVLEHLDDDREALRALRHLLRPGGSLLVTVPAYQWLWSGHDIFLHHRRRYTAARLRRVLEDSGYRVGKLSYFNTLLMPLAALTRLLANLRGRTRPAGGSLPPAWINALLFRTFRSEKVWLGRKNFPFGVSLLAVTAPRSDRT